MAVYFVQQKKHNVNGNWDNNVHAKATEGEALHQFHAFMSTYGYGYGQGLDYVGCEVTTMDGLCIKSEYDNRMEE